MTAEAFNPPPAVTTLVSYPIAAGVCIAVALTILLLYVAGRFDQTGGPLTISILIVLGMLGACAYCLIFTVPQDDITPGVVGGLTAGFGAVVAYWLGRAQPSRHDRPPDGPSPP
jgi:hypothetical protein